MPMGQLTQVLREFMGARDERLLVGPETVDDAGVVRLGEAEGLPAGSRIALVQTIDYFPPIVDDPRAYGAIAAANALSDVYAMGGRPLSALNLAGFPKGFPAEWIAEIFRGGFEKVRESGAVLAGGHTVESAEPLFGFAVTGLVDPELVTANDRARPGDAVYLTKPLGMGSLTTAAKQGRIPWDDMRAAAHSMAQLNAAAAEAMIAARAHACTDVTGFGLLGHASNVARASGVTLRLRLADLPVFPGALEQARAGVFSGGTKRGKAALAGEVDVAPGLEPALVDLVYDAETSGGLLIFLAADRAGGLERELVARGVPVWRVGEVLERGGVLLELA